MNYRPLSAIVLVAVVVLAGCSGGIPFTGDGQPKNGTTTDSTATTQPPATDTQTTIEPTRTPTATATRKLTPTPTNTEQPSTVTTTVSATQTASTTSTAAVNGTEANSVTFPPGYSASGITNPERAFENHLSELYSTTNFTFTRSLPIGNHTFNRTVFFQFSLAEKRAYATVNVAISGKEFGDAEQYQTEDTYYVARIGNDTAVYDATSQSFMSYLSVRTYSSFGSQNVLSNTTQALGSVRFGDLERVTRDGETLLRYESTDLLDPVQFVPNSAIMINNAAEFELNGTVNKFNATVLVGTEGIIRLFKYSITYTKSNGKQVTTTGTVRVSRINATTVEKPAWLDEAKAQTGRPTTGTGTGNSTTSETDFAVESPASVDELSVSALWAQGERAIIPMCQR